MKFLIQNNYYACIVISRFYIIFVEIILIKYESISLYKSRPGHNIKN